MEDFELELKSGFLEEAAQLLQDAEQCFLSLETSPNDKSILEKIFRLAHNLKGSAKAVGFDDMGHLTHQLESLLLRLKNGDLAVTKPIVDVLLKCNDHINQMIDTLRADMGARVDSSELLGLIADAIEGRLTSPEPHAAAPEPVAAEPTPEPVPEPVPTPEPVPSESAPDEEVVTEDDVISPEEVAQITKHEDEMFAAMAKETEQQVATATREPSQIPKSKEAATNKVQADESIRVSLARLEKLLNFVGELVILQTVLQEQSQKTSSMLLRKTTHQMGKVTKEVQDISMSLRMVPLRQTFQKMQRIVRDTASSLGKKIHLTLEGEDTEVDKTVLENLSDPLVHMVRNSVDHGVESSNARLAKGKSETGEILLSAYHHSGKLIIEVRDDGAGIDPQILKAKAFEKGIIKPGAVLSDQEAIELIFAAGFSTKNEVSDVSGRGVGMDVVKSNIERLQGEVLINSQVGKGSTMKIVLPLTLAIVEGMVIRSEGERFVIPLSHVHESCKPTREDVQTTTGMGEVLLLRGENLPLYRLPTLLGRKSQQKAYWEGIAIVVRTEAKPFAVLVDDIVGQHQIVIKKLGKELQNVRGFSGSAILGDGRPSLILELADLVTRSSSGASRVSQTEQRRMAA